MLECSYAREPVDYKLLSLRLLKKIWIIIAATLAGVLLIGGTYFLVKVVYGPEKEYEIESMYYLDFAEDSSGTEYTYINQFTWNEVVHTDDFVDFIYEELNGELTTDVIRNSIEATLLSDTRYPYSTVTTNNPELTERLTRALEQAFIHFGEIQKEFNEIRIVKSPEKATQVFADVRTLRACILGGVIGLFISLLLVWIYTVADSSIYVPATIEKRYHIPTLGTLGYKEFDENFKYLFKDILASEKACIAVTSADSKTDIQKITSDIKTKTGMNAFGEVLNVCENPEEVEKLRKADGVLLLVRAGAHNGKMLERTLEQLGRQDVKVSATLLVDADEKLINNYYRFK